MEKKIFEEIVKKWLSEEDAWIGSEGTFDAEEHTLDCLTVDGQLDFNCLIDMLAPASNPEEMNSKLAVPEEGGVGGWEEEFDKEFPNYLNGFDKCYLSGNQCGTNPDALKKFIQSTITQAIAERDALLRDYADSLHQEFCGEHRSIKKCPYREDIEKLSR